MSKYFKWESGFNRQLVLSKIAECRIVGKNDSVSFGAAELQYWMPVLESAIRASIKIRYLKHQCIRHAINDRDTSLKDCDTFLLRCDVAYEELSSHAKRNFIVLTSITYSGLPLFTTLLDNEIVVKWQNSSKSRFMRAAQKARKNLAEVRRSHYVPDEPPEITNLLVYVSALNPLHAHELATDAVDSLRGILNLLVNSHRGMNIFPTITKPHAINRFRSGPYRTIHNPDGSLATETFWYENRWVHNLPTVKFEDKNNKITRKNIRGWWDKLQRSPLHDHVKQGLLRYCRALDLHDAEPVLLELWGSLESLTGTQREKYDLTIERVVRLFKDHDDVRQIAQHFKLRRNANIHAARTLHYEEADIVLSQAEMLVSQVLFFCLQNGRKFIDYRDFFSFLDLSLDKKQIMRRMELSKIFLKHRQR